MAGCSLWRAHGVKGATADAAGGTLALEASLAAVTTAVPLIRARNLARFGGVAHGFTTRAGGISSGPYATLDLARRADQPGVARENWARVARALDPDLSADHVALLDQVHGADVVVVAAARGPEEVVAAADGAVTPADGLVLAVRVADCAPILIASPRGIAAVHAGWRGTAARIVEAAVAALAELTGDPPAAMAAAIGPCISGAAYEVGPEVVDGIANTGVNPDLFVRVGPGGKPHVDLAAALEVQLRRAGIADVEAIGACTVADPRFYSHRRDHGVTGRFAGVIARLPRRS